MLGLDNLKSMKELRRELLNLFHISYNTQRRNQSVFDRDELEKLSIRVHVMKERLEGAEEILTEAMEEGYEVDVISEFLKHSDIWKHSEPKTLVELFNDDQSPVGESLKETPVVIYRPDPQSRIEDGPAKKKGWFW